jgi:hypothetical protein
VLKNLYNQKMKDSLQSVVVQDQPEWFICCKNPWLILVCFLTIITPPCEPFDLSGRYYSRKIDFFFKLNLFTGDFDLQKQKCSNRRVDTQFCDCEKFLKFRFCSCNSWKFLNFLEISRISQKFLKIPEIPRNS